MSDPAAQPPGFAPAAYPTRGAALSLAGVTRVWQSGAQKLEVFRNATAELMPGEVVALVGPSGSGKSSLLHIAGLLEPPTEGEVYVGGRATGRFSDAERTKLRREEIGFVYQFHHLLPEFSALENVVLPQLIAGRRRSDAVEHATRLLGSVGLAARLDHRPARLSGGEQQRVAIARALANQPRLLLADEPTGNLDPKTAASVFQLLIDTCRTRHVGALIATHNLQITTRMDRTWLLHEGRLIDAGKIQA